MKPLQRTILVFLGIALSLNIFLLSFQWLALNKSYYVNRFEALEVRKTIGIDKFDLTRVVSELIDFMDDGTGDLNLEVDINGTPTPYFNPKEIHHMEDIYWLFFHGRRILFGIQILMLLGIVYLYLSKLNGLAYLSAIKIAVKTAILGIGSLGLLGLMDFDWAFVKFHEIFFNNDLWLLDPRTDRLIQLMPLPFFIGFVIHWLLMVFVIHALLFAGTWASSRFIKAKKIQ